MYISAGAMEQFDFAKAVGIGMIDVAINLTKICLKEKPKEIVFVGSAGSYGRCEIFEIVESKSACNIESSSLSCDSYTPIENIVSCETSEFTVNSSNYITTSVKLSDNYLHRDIDVENMEFYSVLKVAKTFGIEARGIFIVTNYCNENAHVDFINNHKKAMRLLKNKIKEEMI